MRLMKDSGIEWVGDIPTNWQMIPIKYLASYNDEVLSENTEPDFEFDYIEIGSVEYGKGITSTEHLKFSQAPSRARRIVRANDIIVSTVRTYLRAVAPISSYNDKQIASTGFVVIRPKTIVSSFLRYAILSENFICTVEANSTGISYPAINAGQVLQIKIPVPNSAEQQRIADFLDKKCAEIDAVIEKTKATIEEYKKLKQSIITEAVTKGIRGNRPTKDSGIEWIGEIPAEWDVKVAFQLFQQVKNKNGGLVEKNLLSLSYGKIKRKSIDTVGGLLPENFDGYNIIEKDDIVLRLTDLQNDHTSLRVGLSPERGIVTSAYVTLRNQSDNIPLYLYYYLHSFDVHKGFYGMGAGVRQGLNWDGLKLLKIVLPGIEEQKEITDYLEKRCIEIDALITKKTALLQETENYKKSVIYEYVTGKKEVK